MAKRGRVAKIENKRWIVNVLENVETVSRFHKIQLVEMGYLAPENKPRSTRGRPEVVYVPTNKGKNLVRLSKNWIKKEKVA